MHWIIGTAGHIDHGKTSLVLALTGIDTDRLKEEKARGISIDLGFASLQLSDGTRAGVVDVPGHERFIRNMLAGAHGIDLVLFTVAADDGVMPQTQEHLDIVHLLGVTRGVFVLTKVDLVSAGRATEVEREIERLTAGTAFESAAIVRFSATTGAGREDIVAAIERALITGRKVPPAGRFRLPVDRSFTSAGHGLVVTGTAISGTVRAGDQVRCLPSGETLRVRTVEVHGEAVSAGSWGQRIALNLTGAHPVSITRGDVIVDQSLTLTCARFDAIVEIRPSAGRAVKAHQRVRVHIGTTERIGKIVPLGSRDRPDADSIPPGARAFCQLILTEPVVAMRGDRFIVRDETARQTLGGGHVLLPAAPKRRRSDASLLDTLDALAGSDDETLLPAIVEGSGAFAVTASWLALRVNDTEDGIRARAAAISRLHALAVDTDVHYTTVRLRAEAVTRLARLVSEWHAANPLSPGVDLEEARGVMAPAQSPRLFRALLDELAGEGRLAREGSALRLPSHRVVVSGDDQLTVDRIIAALAATPLAPPDAKQLAESTGVERTKLIGVLKAMERSGAIIAVASDLYFLSEVVRRLAAELTQQLGAGTLTTAAFRDRHGTSRKYAIPLLEYFDRQGITVRRGDVRMLRSSGKTS